MLDNNESLTPTIHPDFPISIKIEIEQALGIDITRIQRPKSGMWAHTYLIGNEAHQWIVRVQKAPAPRLKKSLLVQKKAASVGMHVPKIIAYRLDTSEKEDYIWIVEEYVCGFEFYPEKFDRETRLAISIDIGRQLRLLHTVKVNGFGLLAQVKAYELLTVDAAVTGDRDAAYQALLAHPLGPQAGQIQAVLDDLLETHRDHLPLFQ